jgi:potassium efflux system protein
MSLFKFMVYCLFVYVSIVGLPAQAEQSVANPETTEAASTVTLQWIKARKAAITKAQAALKQDRKALQAEEQTRQNRIDSLAKPENITQQMLEDAAKKRDTANQKVEELRVERQRVQDSLDKHSARFTELQTTLQKLSQIPRAELTVVQNQERTAVEKDVALYKPAVELGQQYLELFKTQTELAIKQALVAIEWDSQLQTAHQTHLLKKREQAITDNQTALAHYKETLHAAQSDLPNKIAALETTESTVDMLKERFEKALRDKQNVENDVNNLESERQSAKTNLDKKSKYLKEQEEKLENLRKTPPVEPEQMPLHEKRIAVFENNIKLQKKARELEQQQLDVVTQRIEQAKKRLALATQWYDKLQAVYHLRQKQALEKQIQQKQQRYLDMVAELRQELELIPALEENSAQRELLKIKIQEANEFAQRAGRQLTIRHIREQFHQWEKMAEERKEATDLSQSKLDNTKAVIAKLNTSISESQEIQTQLEKKMATLEKQQEVVKEQGEILSGLALSKNTQAQKLLTKLKNIIRQELDQVRPLLKKGDELLKRIENIYRENMHRALLRQRDLPNSAVAWWGLIKEIGTIPSIVLQHLQHTGRGFWQAFQQASKQRWLIIGLVMLVWLSLVIGLSAWAKRIFKTSDSIEKHGSLLKHLGKGSSPSVFNTPKLPSLGGGMDGFPSLLLVGLRLWQKNAVSIAVTGVFLLLIWLTQPNHLSTIVTLILLLTWLGGKLLIDLSGLLLSASEFKSQDMTKLSRQVRWTIIVLGLLIVITALVHQESEGQVGLSLTARDLVDTLFMVLLVLTIPIFMRVRLLILTLMRTTHTKGYWLLAINLITLLLPGLILAVSILGVMGYIPLGWTVAHYSSLFLLVLFAWLIARGILNELIGVWKNSVSKDDSQSGSLWAEDLIPLVHKLLGLALLGLAVIAVLGLTGGYSDVAIKEDIERMLYFSFVTFKNGNQITVLGVLLSLLLVWFVFWLAGWFRRVSYRWLLIQISDAGIRHSLSVFIQYIVILVGLLIALKVFGIDPTALVVLAGAVGVGIGFGLQNIADNFVSGILLLVERPLQVGDFVEIESPQGNDIVYSGTVILIGIRSLTLETEDSKKVVVPNSKLISGPFTNWAGCRTTDEGEGEDEGEGTVLHTDLDIGISYDSDPHLAENLIKAVLEEMPEVLSEPAFGIYLLGFADFKINFRVDYYIDSQSSNSAQVKSKVLFGIWDRFKEAGIKMPYPPQGLPLQSVC